MLMAEKLTKKLVKARLDELEIAYKAKDKLEDLIALLPEGDELLAPEEEEEKDEEEEEEEPEEEEEEEEEEEKEEKEEKPKAKPKKKLTKLEKEYKGKKLGSDKITAVVDKEINKKFYIEVTTDKGVKFVLSREDLDNQVEDED